MKKSSLKTAGFSCPYQALRHVGLAYGAERFANETYQSVAVVYNKLNPDNESNHPSLRDVIALTDKSNDTSIIEALCHHFGGVFVKVPDQVCCDEELSDQLMKVSETLGCALGEIRQARTDGVIDQHEFEQIKQKLMATVTEALALKELVKGQVRDLPRHPSAVISKEA